MRKVLWSGILASAVALGPVTFAAAAPAELYKAQFSGGQQFSKGGIPGQDGFPIGNDLRRPNFGPNPNAGGGGFGRGGGRFGQGGGFRGGGFGGDRGGYRRGGGFGGAAVGAGVAGLAAGALIGGAIANQRYYGGPSYGYGGYGYDYDDAPVYGAPAYAAPTYVAPAYAEGDQTAYCVRRYKSYDPASGTYLGYDGLRHPCP